MNIITLEELEKLTEKLYGPHPDSNLLDNANLLRETYKSNFGNFGQLFSFLIESKSQHCLFWLLELLTYIINTQYKSFSDEQKAKFREFIVFIIENHIQQVFIASFIEIKFCVLIISLMKHDYPENWPSLFKDLISLIFKTTEVNVKMLKVSLLVDILLAFDDELIKFRHTYSDYEVTRSTIIKDFMRIEAVADCTYVLNQLMQNDKHFTKKLIKSSIKVIAQLVDWNALNLFEESVKIITSSLINQPDYMNESLEVLNAIIEKGMEPNQKLDLIKYLNVNEILNNLLKDAIKLNENSLFHICEVVGNIGNFTIECFEMVKSLTKGEQVSTLGNINPQELFTYVQELTNNALYQSITIINLSFKIEVKTALNLCDFISNLTTYLKSNPFIAETFDELLKSLVKTIENYLIIPQSEYDIKSALLMNREDDDFFNFRKEFSILYHNFFPINSLKVFMLQSILDRLDKVSNAVTQQGGFGLSVIYEVELTLHLIHVLQSAISQADIQNTTCAEYFNKLLFGLFSIPFGNTESDHILILFYDTVYKYMQYIINNDNILVYVIRMYLSKQGIMHGNPLVGAKICTSFDKFVDKVKTQLGKLDIIYDVSDTLKNFLHYLCADNKNIQLLSEYSVLFKTLGLVILQKNFQEEKRHSLFKEVLTLFDSIILNFGLDNEKFIELCKCISNFIKCIGYELNPNCKILFIDYFNNFINNIYLKFPKNTDVDYSMLTIIQRLITILGKDSLQYVEYFINQQAKFSEYEMYEDFCKLLQNSTQLLKKESKTLNQNCFHYFFISIKNLKLPQTNISEVEKNVISVFSNFAKLLANITMDIVEVFFENGGVKNVDLLELIKFMVYIAHDVIDPNIRRSIVKSLKCIVLHIIKLLTTIQQNEDTNTLLNYTQIILSGTFQIYSKLNLADPIDYNTLPEIVQLHFYVYKSLQNFYVNYISNFLNPENIQIFIENLNGYDVKKFKVGDVIINYFNYISTHNWV